MSSYELLEDVSSNANDFVNSAWILTRIDSATPNAAIGPSGILDASQFTWASSNRPAMEQTLFVAEAGQEKPITVGIWARIDAGNEDGLIFSIRDAGLAQVGTSLEKTITESWNLFSHTHTFSSNYVNSEFEFRVIVTPSGSSGDTFYLSHPFVYVDCRHIDIQPNPNYEVRHEKIQDTNLTSIGKRGIYEWSKIERDKFIVEHLSRREKDLVNSWWKNNKNLIYIVNSGDRISSVQLTNKQLPIGKLLSPLITEYMGTIELGTY